MPATWQDVYQSSAQGLYALVAVPTVFLLWLLVGSGLSTTGVEPRAARFVRAWALVFGIAAILDPLVTGPVLRALGLADGPVATIGLVTFVLLGDFRVFLLLVVVAAPDRPRAHAVREAALWTVVVPAFAWTVTGALRAVRGDVPPMTIWVVYETAFACLALGWRAVLVPRRVAVERSAVRRYVRAVLAYLAAYYALWAASDALILGAALDAAWGLRIVPNQLYYAFWIPFAYWRFFAPRYASTSRSTHASR